MTDYAHHILKELFEVIDYLKVLELKDEAQRFKFNEELNRLYCLSFTIRIQDNCLVNLQNIVGCDPLDRDYI